MQLSVIIPIYNKIQYVTTILQQVRQQSFSDFECLLIDDGSTDGSGAVCDEYATMDFRFRVLHTPNCGVSHARNVGLDAAQGEYITFIDADDSIKPDYLKNLIERIKEGGVDLLISGYEKVSAEGDVLLRVLPPKTGIFSIWEILPDFAQTQKETGLYGCCVAKVFPRRLVERIRFNEELKLAEDFDFYLNLYETVDSICLDDYAGYRYLQDADNSTANTPDDKLDYLAQLRIHLHYRSVLKKRNAYIAENQKILEERLTDYAFFVLFHTPISAYKERFTALHTVCRENTITLSGNGFVKKWLFFCLRHGLYHTAKGTIALYRAARRIGNGLK